MFKNKMMQLMVIILIAVTLIVGAGLYFWFFVVNKEANSNDPSAKVENVEVEELSAEEIAELTTVMENITTNMSDMTTFVQIAFAFQLDNADAKHEFDTLLPYVKSIIIRTLNDTKPDGILSPAASDAYTANLMNLINEELKEGKVTKIEITNKLLSSTN